MVKQMTEIKEPMEGYYVQVNANFVGVFPSKEGPKLFYNREIYPLTNGCWDVELLLGKENILFTFYWNGEVKISFRCEKHREFFLWLFNLMNSRVKTQKYA